MQFTVSAVSCFVPHDQQKVGTTSSKSALQQEQKSACKIIFSNSNEKGPPIRRAWVRGF
jgi:hypothetical protein